jgi:hypothetical protein
MRTRTMCIGIALFSCSTLLSAQQGLIGSYEGRFVHTGFAGYGPQHTYATLEIANADNGKLAGKLKIERHWAYACEGDYVVQGTYQDNKLDLLTSEGVKRGCGKESLVLTVQGNKLVGTFGSSEIELGKK